MCLLTVVTKVDNIYTTLNNIKTEIFNVESINSFMIASGWLNIITTDNKCIHIKESDVVRIEFIP